MKAGGGIATVVDTGTVGDIETADETVGTVEDTGTVGLVAVELRRSSWRRWGRP